jgi:hypothetical protein
MLCSPDETSSVVCLNSGRKLYWVSCLPERRVVHSTIIVECWATLVSLRSHWM